MKCSGDLSCYVLPKSPSGYAAYDFSDQEAVGHAVISVLAARLPIGCLRSKQLDDQVPVQPLLQPCCRNSAGGDRDFLIRVLMLPVS